MNGHITLHPDYGVNPSVMLCYFCGEASGVALLGRNGGKEAPRQAVFDREPCDACKKLMVEGIMIIEVTETESTPKHAGGSGISEPYRTGNMVGLRREAFARMFSGEGPAKALEIGWCFMDQKTFQMLFGEAVAEVKPE